MNCEIVNCLFDNLRVLGPGERCPGRLAPGVTVHLQQRSCGHDSEHSSEEPEDEAEDEEIATTAPRYLGIHLDIL